MIIARLWAWIMRVTMQVYLKFCLLSYYCLPREFVDSQAFIVLSG